MNTINALSNNMSNSLKKIDINLSFLQVQAADKMLKVLTNRVNQNILLEIHKSEQLNVSEIATRLGLVQSDTSFRLSRLKFFNLVFTSRDKKNIYYRLNQARLAEIYMALNQITF